MTKSTFLTPLIVEPLSGTNDWRVVEPFTYVVGHLKSPWKIEVPKDFVTDFASIPRVFWSILPPTGRWGKAAVVHDYLYREGLASRAVCDEVFLEAMKVLGVSWYKRKTIYYAVRLFGRSSYKGENK